MHKNTTIMRSDCRNNPCTCTSDEEWSCLTDQWNKFDRPAQEEKQDETNQKFKESVEIGDIKEAQRLLPEVKLK